MSKMTEPEFYDRLDRASDPLTVRKLKDDDDLSCGGDGSAKYDDVFSQLDSLSKGDDAAISARPNRLFSDADYERVREDTPALKIVREYTPRYDRAFQELRALENKLAILTAETPEYHEAMAQLSKVKSRVKIELERSTDDRYRENERTDEWRATTGKEEFKASRRVRETANQMTPKEVLAAETPEEKNERIRKRGSELKAKKRAMKKAAEAKDHTA
tara:strand:- start:126515 stop:127165 length:651 start_codon:yes stop_codon:yes gene_type:complete